MNSVAMNLAILFCVAGCSVGPQEPTRGYEAMLIQETAIFTHGQSVKPSPDPKGICDNCNGTGKVGDGTVMLTCTKCDGTGRLGAFGSDLTCDSETCLHPACDGACSAQCLCRERVSEPRRSEELPRETAPDPNLPPKASSDAVRPSPAISAPCAGSS